uniref:Conjugal transfer protein MobA n=1 Tax=Prevotella sp. GTC17262 TaxID=3236797 RepID=A0AB33JUQ1_9BACT
MTEKNGNDRKHKAGRKRKSDPAVFRYGIKLNAEEKGRFEALFQKSGMTQRARFIKSVLLERELKVVRIDKATMDYYIRLTNFYHQFQAIGNNYNQTVKAVKKNFGDKRAFVLLRRLEKATLELVMLSRQVVSLTQEYRNRYLDHTGNGKQYGGKD